MPERMNLIMEDDQNIAPTMQALERLREKVNVHDRSHKGVLYPRCFLSSEATDILSLGRSRREAVKV